MYEVGPLPEQTSIRQVAQIRIDSRFGVVQAGSGRVSQNRVVFSGNLMTVGFQPCIVIWDYVKGTIQSFNLTTTGVNSIFLKASTTQAALVLCFLFVESELISLFMDVYVGRLLGRTRLWIHS